MVLIASPKLFCLEWVFDGRKDSSAPHLAPRVLFSRLGAHRSADRVEWLYSWAKLLSLRGLLDHPLPCPSMSGNLSSVSWVSTLTSRYGLRLDDRLRDGRRAVDVVVVECGMAYRTKIDER